MDPARYPFVLGERLGPNGADALAEVLASHRDEVMTLVTSSFERRLAQECGQLRIEMANLRGDLRADMGELRGEMSAFRSEMRAEMAGLRQELRSDFKTEIANVKTDLLKWSLAFWVGQLAAVGGLVALLP